MFVLHLPGSPRSKQIETLTTTLLQFNVLHSELPKPQMFQKSLQGFSLHILTHKVVQCIDYSHPKGTWTLPEISSRWKRATRYYMKQNQKGAESNFIKNTMKNITATFKEQN